MIGKLIKADKVLQRGGRYMTIVLAGFWYLLTPPMSGQHGIDTTTPLSNWTNAGVYNTQQDCQTAQNNYAAMLSSAPSTQQQTINILAIERSQCVSSDDYRLQSGQSASTQASAQLGGGQSASTQASAQLGGGQSASTQASAQLGGGQSASTPAWGQLGGGQSAPTPAFGQLGGQSAPTPVWSQQPSH
jgi:hypothetical protein